VFPGLDMTLMSLKAGVTTKPGKELGIPGGVIREKEEF
jgi:hypothetical protein